MQLIIIHRNANSLETASESLLNFALTNEPVSKIIFDDFKNSPAFQNCDTMLAIPRQWQISPCHRQNAITYDDRIFCHIRKTNKGKGDRWFIISNGRFVTNFDHVKLNRLLSNYSDGIVAVDVTPDLLAYREKVQVTSNNNLAGFRRLYSDSILPASIPTDWPAHVFIKCRHLHKILNGGLPSDFSEFLENCKSNFMKLDCFQIGGTVLDLGKENDLIRFLTAKIKYHPHDSPSNVTNYKHHANNSKIPTGIKTFGNIILGNNVRIDENVILAGPVIICDNVTIERCSVIRSSIIGPGKLIPEGSFVRSRVITNLHSNQQKSLNSFNDQQSTNRSNFSFDFDTRAKSHFRIWHKLSYVRSLKRIVDLVISLIVLILFAPFIPLIAIFIKLNSKGPIFFKHKRQGLYGKEFDCLKFRTMIIGADDIQAKLRSKNQVDGPQFKVEDDPRVTIVGRFLRNTFIDEIPQFINVLLGQMSLVGPRPSPKKENSTCPFWRDARLSVRPGITGLWQISRTRLPGRDFQEWIHYDTLYVKNLSLMLDIKICLRTAKKLAIDFVKQF